MDLLQGVTAAFAVAELAKETAVFIWKVSKAHKDARALYEKTLNLSKLVQVIARTLERRQDRRGNRPIAAENGEIEESILSSLNLCKSCLESLHKKYAFLLEKTQSRKQMVARVKFVLKQESIFKQEQDIFMHVQTLSVLLHCLFQEDHTDQLVRGAMEHPSIEQSAQNLQRMHEDFLRQLFDFFVYVFQQQQRATSTSHPSHQSSCGSVHVGPRDRPSIQNEDGETVDDLFGTPGSSTLFPSDFSMDTHDQEGELAQQVPQISVDPEDQVEEIIVIEEASDEYEDEDSLSEDSSFEVQRYASETTLLLAVKSNKTDVIRSILENDVDITWKDTHGWTFLHHAVFSLHEEVFDMLLDHPDCKAPDTLNAQTETGETALIYATQRVHKQEGYNIAMKLIAAGCDTKISDGNGSALYYAVSQGRPTHKPRQSLVSNLVKNGADVQPVYDDHPDRVRDYDALAAHVKSIQGDNDSDNSGNARRQRTRSNADSLDPGNSTPRRSSFLRRFRTRSPSSPNDGSFGSTPPT